MKKGIIILLLVAGYGAMAQKQQEALTLAMKKLHEAMVSANKDAAAQYLDDSLSYGHSSGWIENKKDFLADLGGKLEYHSMEQDSTVMTISDDVAHIRFVTDVDVSLNNNRVVLHLRVLEVWVRNKSKWKLFARQAIR